MQSTSDVDSVRRIQDARTELAELFAKIESVRERALETERTITEMTADIKRLDSTKKNLTLSMTALKRLQMLTTAYEQLRALILTRQYRESAHLLQAVIQLMAHFKSYRSIEQIATLSRNVAELQRELLEQICEDFELAFTRGEVRQKRTTLAEACQVMDALGGLAKARLITWYCNTQLREYRQVFRGMDEAGSLDNVSRRYSWFNRLVKTYDTEHVMLFPPHWRVNEMLANAFCETTRDDLKTVLQHTMRRADGQAPDVDLLLSCLQDTLDFEHSLERRFSATESRSSIDTLTSAGEDKRAGFSQVISEAFEPYLSIWVESQDRHLATLIPKYRQQPIRSPEEEFHSQLVMSSSTELFHQYRVTLAQCARLSTAGRLLDLSQTFGKYLDAYCQQVLLHCFSHKPGGASIEDAIIVLNTADYCYTTTNQLEEKIRARIDEELRPQVDMQSQADAFMGIASASIRTLVSKTEADCAPAWREMRNVAWGTMDNVGDQSPYVSTLLQRVMERSREILGLVQKAQYKRAYCDHVVDSVTNHYMANMVAARPISETGAEQMLLDSYVLKQGLSLLATIGEDRGRPPNPAFVKRVHQSAAKLDHILKTLQVRASPSEGFVQGYLIHLRDRSEANFRKLLEIKGVPRKEQSALIELFTAHKKSPANASLPASNPLVASLQLSAPPGATGSLAALKDSTLSPSTPSLPARFDPAQFGTALINAARDAGDRFGTPSHAASRTTSPPLSGAAEAEASGGLNENLKNFGKFFRRDMHLGGFGWRDTAG